MSWLSNLASNPSQTLFFFLLIFIPSQLGRHFWPEFAFVNGLRVDYLSPTLFLTDILIGLLFIELLPLLLRQFKRKIFLGMLVFLAVGLYTAHQSISPLNSYLGVLRVAELFFVGFCVNRFFSQRSFQPKAALAISIALLYTAVLAASQFVLQHSVGGLWYWLGERTFSGLTPGIANVSLQGTLVLRPYATFPHPNVLGGFCVLVVTYLLFFTSRRTLPSFTYILSRVAIVLGLGTVVLSLSRTSLLAICLVLFVWFLQWKTSMLNRALVFLIVLLGVGLFSQTILSNRLTSFQLSDEAVVVREYLIHQATVMFQAHPLLGVGLQNFLPVLATQQPPLTPHLFFQPVHSIYLLVVAESGVVGAGIALMFLLSTVFRILKKSSEKKLGKLLLLLVVLLLGSTDHYLITLRQGQLLLAFVFGVLWISSWENGNFTLQNSKILRKAKQLPQKQIRLKSQPMKNSRKGKSSRTKKGTRKSTNGR